MRKWTTAMGALHRMSILIVLAALVTCGCALIRLKQDIDTGADSALLYGITQASENGPIIVVAYRQIGGQVEVAAHVRQTQPGAWELLVPSGDYYLACFQDANGNARLDGGEAWARFGAPELIDARGHQMIGNLNMVLATGSDPPAPLTALAIDPAAVVDRAVAGEVVDAAGLAALDEHNSLGYWEPFAFFQTVGANIWFTEPFDARKIPILFVHGAGGALAEWETVLAGLDRSRYQPWIFYYPSGLPLEYCAYFMALKLSDLQRQHGLARMGIVAHSMGGLVARSFLLHYADLFPGIELFISISTPWGGVDLAQRGVERAPVVVPCWRDIASNSAFISGLYARRLPESVRHYLLFGFAGNRNPLRPNNDGTITIESMLDRRAQQEAVRVDGFNASHAGILTSPETMALLRDILARELPPQPR